MSLITITNRDKKMIIWNFMEELWNKDKNAVGNGLPTRFYLKDFNFVRTLDKFLCRNGVRESLTDTIIWEIIKDYALDKRYFEMSESSVILTSEGIIECQKPVHDWD
jgi:hypothetical protein